MGIYRLEGRAMTIYYERDGVRVTEQCVEVAGTCYPLAELGRIEVAPPTGLSAVFRVGRRWELWAEHRGAWVLLFATGSERIFGQVGRAVTRAREARQPAARHR
ncbi:DUF6232 family protein [Longispora fulva]|uniref:Uncharacterized protein n=1 Tax=Longispora fulva TaxID=619741 RepID=A0A8J7GF19_9ACTN|nr:DUF6232 family protein [Longispora fulva]MBG6139458.1 hypothetical protein [Longispora fulva]